MDAVTTLRLKPPTYANKKEDTMVAKGYKFTPEQLANRKRKQKGKWSKKAKERQSIRLKAYWQAKGTDELKKKFKMPVFNVDVDGTSTRARLLRLAHELQVIADQLGG